MPDEPTPTCRALATPDGYLNLDAPAVRDAIDHVEAVLAIRRLLHHHERECMPDRILE